MGTRLILLSFFFALVLGLASGQAWGQWRVAYYDERYRESWTGDGASATVRDAFRDVGYEILDADQLKTFMDARIADGAPSVVVLCRDNAPDTVVESNSPDCTLRKYLDSGGKVVFCADAPFWYVAHSDGTRTTYKEAGCANILGISGTTYDGDWVNGDHGTATITSKGAEWGLTETWTSIRWVPPDQVDIVLATDSAGNAAAWVKHFVPGDTTGGFVRIWDIWMDRDTIPNVDDLIAVAEYGLPDNPLARVPSPADGATHLDTWITSSWFRGDFGVSHDVYLSDNFDDVNDGTGDAFRGNQEDTYYFAGFPGFAYPDGLVPGTTYFWRIDEIDDLHPDSPWKGNVWSFSIPPKTAYNPNPADGAELVDPNNVILSWSAGFGAISHTIFLGDDYNEVDNATEGISQNSTTYSAGTLEAEKMYYWRVDESDSVETYKGDVWTFTTSGTVGKAQPQN